MRMEDVFTLVLNNYDIYYHEFEFLFLQMILFHKILLHTLFNLRNKECNLIFKNFINILL